MHERLFFGYYKSLMETDPWRGLSLLISYKNWDVLASLIYPTIVAIVVVFIVPIYTCYFLITRPPTKLRKSPSNKKLSSTNLLHGNPNKRISKSYSFYYGIFVGYILFVSLLESGSGLADFFHGQDVENISKILRLAPTIRKGPTVPIWFQNRHIQFIPWLVQNELHKIGGGIPYERIEFSVTDCIKKTSKNCEQVDVMNDTVTLDIFPPMGTEDEGFSDNSPVIIFAPGLRCHSQDLPGNSIIRSAYGKGFRSVVMNRRGHTPEQLLRSPRWNIFGDIDDLEQVYWFLKDEIVAPHTGFFLHGISSGTAVTVLGLAEFDRRRAANPQERVPVFVGATTVTPGYDIQEVMQPDRFKWPYNPLLNLAVKDHFILQNEKILRDFNSKAVDNALKSNTLQEFVNATAAFTGFEDPETYYEFTNPVKGLHHITTPTFVLNSLDDPCCAIQNLYEKSKYPAHNGLSYADVIKTSPSAIVAVTHLGSHCPFLDGYWPFVKDPFTKGVMLKSWADQSIIDFYSAAMEVYGDRRFLMN